jgi:hypothetical protein
MEVEASTSHDVATLAELLRERASERQHAAEAAAAADRYMEEVLRWKQV